MFPFNKENPELRFTRDQNVEQRRHEEKVENFKASTQDDQTALNMQEDRSDLLKWQQDLDPELQKLIHTLKGEIIINDTWTPRTFWKGGKLIRATPMCNDRFIQEVIVPQCSPFIDRNIINTYFEEIEILSNLKNTCDDIADAMCDHYDEYGIEFTNYDIIMRNIKNVIKPGAYRALKGWTKKIDSTIIRRVEQSNESENKEKKGFSKLMGS